MANGPTRGEILFRLTFSLLGLCLLVAAVLIRGVPNGPAMFEVIGIAGAFFGGSVVWCLLKLRRTNDD